MCCWNQQFRKLFLSALLPVPTNRRTMAAPLQLNNTETRKNEKTEEVHPPNTSSFTGPPRHFQFEPSIPPPVFSYLPHPTQMTPTTFPDQTPPSFVISGSSSEELTIYLYPHQTLFTHNNYVHFCSDKLNVEHMPCLQLPSAFNTRPCSMDRFIQCVVSLVSALCKCNCIGVGAMNSVIYRHINFYGTRLLINNNDLKKKEKSIPSICLSASLPMSSPYSFGRRNNVAPCFDSSTLISSPLSRKILRY